MEAPLCLLVCLKERLPQDWMSLHRRDEVELEKEKGERVPLEVTLVRSLHRKPM